MLYEANSAPVTVFPMSRYFRARVLTWLLTRTGRLRAIVSRSGREGVMIRTLAVSIMLLALHGGTMAQAASSPVDYSATWDKFNQSAKRKCPSHHIDFFTDGQYDEVL